jgi:uncharacterized protein YozE (UPF0346 family)
MQNIPAASFFLWLADQKSRNNGDEVGRLAREALKDKTFPRKARKLLLFLHYYEAEPQNREAVKLAHREWRQLRAQTKIAQENPGNQL